MTDKVQKIREEVERVKTVHSSVSLKDSKPDILVVQVCTNLLSFIDFLQEEPNDDWKYSIAEKLGISREEYDKIDYNKDYGKEDYLSEALDIKYKVENGIEEGDKDE